jgi:RNA polymerase sigma-70 factor, ECF subfamily
MRVALATELEPRGADATLPASGPSSAAEEHPMPRAPAERIFELVYRQMHSLWGSWRPDFDDLVQVAAEQALRGLPAFRAEAELSTWTYRICYRAVMRHRRWSMRWLRRFAPSAEAPELPDHRADAPEALQQRERIRALHTALDHLSDKRRAVIVLRDLEGLGIGEIASIVGTGEETVRSRLRDGRRQLAALLRRDPCFAEGPTEDQP